MGFAEATFEMTQGAFNTENEADKKLFVIFNYHPHPDTDESAKQGRPIFKDRVYIMIMVPGDKESVVHRPAYDRDFQRFPQQYQKFQNNQSEAIVGTPLKLMPWLTGSQVKELEYFHVQTVEHLAGVSENLAAKMHGLFGLKKMAQDFLRAAKDAAPLTEMRSELEKRDSQIEALQRQLTELGTKMEKAEKAK